MKAQEFIVEKKKREVKPSQPNPVAKNAMASVGGGGFGAHKDKKAAMKRGDEKHKKNYAMTAEASKPRNPTRDHLRDYPVSDKDVAKPVKPEKKKDEKKAVAEGAKWRSNPDAHDINDDGDIYPKTRDMFAYDPLSRRQSTAGDARTARGKKSVLKTSLKMAQGRHGPKGQLPEEQGVAEGYTGRETKDGTWRVFKDGKAVAVAGPFKSREEAAAWIKKQKTGVAEGSDLDAQAMDIATKLTTGRNLEKLRGMAYDSTVYRALDRYFAKHDIPETIYNRVASIVFKRINQQGVAEGEDDWGSMNKRDFKRKEMEYELRNEPPNNIQVVINGKPWKVFAGRGRPDSAEEFNHLRKMQAWAASKSSATGKKWSVHLTGAPASK